MKKTFLLMIFSFLFLSLVSIGNSEPEAMSSVRFNSLCVDNTRDFNHLRLILETRKAGNFEGVVDLKKAAQKNLEYFFIGLNLPNEKFWVNLNPDEPNRVIEPVLGQTDLGRIMLNADLRLKEDACELLNPETSATGREFWNRLEEKANSLGIADKIPVVTRLWIVSGEVKVSESNGSLRIIKSRLRVSLEPAYLTQKQAVKDKSQKSLDDFASGLMSELILPILDKRVNEAYAYADLREVYHALILARWYKEKFGSYYGSLLQASDIEVLKDAQLDFSYSPQEIYRDYLKSFKSEGYSYSSAFITTQYVSGGIDFKDIAVTKTEDPAAGEAGKNDTFFTCDLFIPQDTQRPLQYAKNQMELVSGSPSQDNNSAVVLVKNLPVIVPLNFAEKKMQGLDSNGRIDRIVLSRL